MNGENLIPRYLKQFSQTLLFKNKCVLSKSVFNAGNTQPIILVLLDCFDTPYIFSPLLIPSIFDERHDNINKCIYFTAMDLTQNQ